MVMTEEKLPLSQIHLLRKDVNRESPSAALPSNLPDYWLELIARDLEETVGEGVHLCEESAKYAAAPLALIIQILSGKLGTQRLELPLDKLFEYFCEYRIEINLEIVNRRTVFKTEPATLETIFTNRAVRRLG